MTSKYVLSIFLALEMAGASAGISNLPAQVKPATVIKKQSNAGSLGQKNLLQFLENPLELCS